MFIKNPFRTITAREIAEHQQHEAERQALEHEAASEHHAALAQMYRARLARLQSLDRWPRAKEGSA